MSVSTTLVPAFACGRCGQLLDNTDGTLRVDDVTVCEVDALDALVVHAAEAA